MKKQILVILILSLFSPLSAVEFYDISFKQAIELAKKEKKLVFLMIEDKHCSWCKKMKSIVLKDKKVLKILNEDYISILVDNDKKELKRKYRTRFVPIMYILDPNGEKELSKTVGYMKSEYFYETLFMASRFDS